MDSEPTHAGGPVAFATQDATPAISKAAMAKYLLEALSHNPNTQPMNSKIFTSPAEVTAAGPRDRLLDDIATAIAQEKAAWGISGVQEGMPTSKMMNRSLDITESSKPEHNGETSQIEDATVTIHDSTASLHSAPFGPTNPNLTLAHQKGLLPIQTAVTVGFAARTRPPTRKERQLYDEALYYLSMQDVQPSPLKPLFNQNAPSIPDPRKTHGTNRRSLGAFNSQSRVDLVYMSRILGMPWGQLRRDPRFAGRDDGTLSSTATNWIKTERRNRAERGARGSLPAGHVDNGEELGSEGSQAMVSSQLKDTQPPNIPDNSFLSPYLPGGSTWHAFRIAAAAEVAASSTGDAAGQ